MLILEITKPAGPIPAFLFRVCFGHLFPLFALISTRSRAARDLVRYYWETMDACVRPGRILDAMQGCGLREVNCNTLFGVLKEYTATKS